MRGVAGMGVRHAVVAGGGIGGLAAAVALNRRGWRVTVCERAPVLTGIGAGIVLAPNALRALDSIGLGPDVWAGDALLGPVGLRTPDGTWLSRTGAGATSSRHGPPARAVHRGSLIDALAAALPPGVVHLGVAVTGVDDTGNTGDRADTVVVRTSAGDLRADVVVAADGVRSVLRGQLFPRHPGLRHAGEAGWRAVLPGFGPPPRSAAETWGRGERFGIVPLVDGRIYVYATAAGPGTKPADHHAELIRRFGAWHDPIPALLDRLGRRNPDPVRVLHHDFYELASPLPRFHSGRVALLGDAAHAMTPNMGQGGCQAIEDAVVVAHLLADDADVPAALAAYTEARHRRTTRISRRSRRIGELARLSHPLAVSARNLAVRATPSAVTSRALDTVLGWQPPSGPAPTVRA